ncbi:MAG: hypothetical protein AMXMBFR49_21410 [Chlorobiota bacterium]
MKIQKHKLSAFKQTLLSGFLVTFLISTGHSQRFNIEQTEVFLNEYWTVTPFEKVSYLKFTDSLNGHMAESYNRFATTTDGGMTWKNKTTLDGQFRDANIVMFSRDTMFYISVNKKLVYSFDGGTTWTITGDVTGVPVDIQSMVFYNRLKGICTTVDGMIYTTSNGGLDWLPYPGLPHNDNTVLLAYGGLTIGFGSNRSFLLSTDEGANWQEYGFTDSINTPNFIKIMNGILYISAGGNTWYKSDLTGQILFQETIPTTTGTVRNFAFPSENEVWAALWDRGTKVSVPGSRVWQNTTYPQNSEVSGVYESLNGRLLVASSGVDDSHAMMRIEQPGKRFSVRKGRLPGNYRLSAVKIVSPEVTLVGSYEGVIFKSTDQGLTWENKSGGYSFPAITCITAKDPMNIFAGCMGGIILRSTNGGSSWSQVNTTISDKITSIEYKATDSIYLTTESKAYYTTLGNLPYLIQVNLPSDPGKVLKVKFWNRLSGIIGGTYRAHRTTNGGKTWIENPYSYLTPINLSVMPGVAEYFVSGRDMIEIRLTADNFRIYSSFRGRFSIVDNDSSGGFMLDPYLGGIMAIYPKQARLDYFLAGGAVGLNDFDYFNSGYSLAVGDGGTVIFPAFKNSQETPLACYNLSPDQMSKVTGKAVQFSWKEPYLLTPNDQFQIEVAREDTANIILSQAGITGTAYTATGLEEEKRYFWRVRARNAFGWGEYTPWTPFILMRQVYTFSEVQLPRWATINSVTQSTNGTVWAVGDSGFVARSTTQGDTWEVVGFPFSDDLKFCTVNPFNSTVFFSSASGELIYTTDGGGSWIRTPAGVAGASVRSMIFTSETEGYLCGTNRLASRTLDGGLNWYLSSVPSSVNNLNSIIKTDQEHLLIATNGGVLLRSTDFGRHYYPDQVFGFDNYHSLFRFNSLFYLFNEYGYALTSSDQGESWQELRLNFEGALRQTGFAGNRFRMLSASGGLYTSNIQCDMLNYQQLQGGSQKKTMFLTTSGNLIVAGSGASLLVGRDTAVVSGFAGDGENGNSPGEFRLDQNYPNPFNGATVIPVHMGKAGMARIEIFNTNGERVTVLLDRELDRGDHLIPFDPGGLPSGIYLYRLVTDDKSLTGKMILLR